jgi:hypothetical protein
LPYAQVPPDCAPGANSFSSSTYSAKFIRTEYYSMNYLINYHPRVTMGRESSSPAPLDSVFPHSALLFSRFGTARPLSFSLSYRSLHQECFTTLLQSASSTLFLKTAGCHPRTPILELTARRPKNCRSFFSYNYKCPLPQPLSFEILTNPRGYRYRSPTHLIRRQMRLTCRQ